MGNWEGWGRVKDVPPAIMMSTSERAVGRVVERPMVFDLRNFGQSGEDVWAKCW